MDHLSRHHTVPASHPDLKPDKVDEAILHHMGHMANPRPTPQQAPVDLIQSWTKSGNPDINYIAYTDLVYDDGTHIIARGPKIGAHCMYHNSHTIGVAWAGDGNQVSPSAAAQDKIVEVIRWRMERFKNIKSVIPHGHRFKTDCCGAVFGRLVDSIAQRVFKPELTQWEQDVMALYQLGKKQGILNTPEYWHKTMWQPSVSSEFTERALLAYIERVDELEKKINGGA
jgi:hypothetical protein